MRAVIILSILRKLLERESNFSQLSLMTMIESGVSTYGMQNLVWGLTFFARDCVELKDYCGDYFLMPRHNRESSLWTVTCRSWRVCTELGMLELPTPHKEILTIEKCLQEVTIVYYLKY
jgi:hypothetical protein